MITRADRRSRTYGSDMASEVDPTTDKYAGHFCTEYHNSVPNNAIAHAQPWVLPEGALLSQVYACTRNTETATQRRSTFLRLGEGKRAF